MIWFRRAVLRVIETLTHAHVCGQNGPHHSPRGDSYDQKPPDHPHDNLGYQKGEVAWACVSSHRAQGGRAWTPFPARSLLLYGHQSLDLIWRLWQGLGQPDELAV